MKILTAMKMLIEKYEKVKNTNYIDDPVAWALYYTWKAADKDRQRKKEDKSGNTD